jgi:16S rRNA (adenine1518-N6/adenine1519-N6)-dimethyltransferase
MTLQELCQRYDIRFKRQLGQNLLLDDNINRIMVEAAALTPDEDVVEVGAGLGALTEGLRRHARRVLAIEIDRAFMPCLEERFANAENVRLFRGDVLNHSVTKLVMEHLPGGTIFKMVSNLPYYITTPILFHFWESTTVFTRMVVMVQEEVALRMVARVGSADYGVLTLAAHTWADVDIVHKVPRTCFRPQPNVDSCIVRFRRKEAPLLAGLEPRFASRVIRTAFAHRRKTLRNSLGRSGGLGAPIDAVMEAFEAANISSDRRPQTLSLEEFARLAVEIRSRVGKSSRLTDNGTDGSDGSDG